MSEPRAKLRERIENIVRSPNHVAVAFQDFFQSQSSSSVVLLIFTLIALVIANSDYAEGYFAFLHTKIGFFWGDAKFALSVEHVVNDFLMAFFFFLVGLEIKRELLVGELSSAKKAILPIMAAIGGMVLPITIYMLFNAGGLYHRGWAIPMATDIAFALGALALFGSRVPIGLKVFLTALAIADDMGAVIVIAVFYSGQLDWVALIGAFALLGFMRLLFQRNLRDPLIYVLLACMIWFFVYTSGIHATIAGILIATVIPTRSRMNPEEFIAMGYKRLQELEKAEITVNTLINDHDHLERLVDLHNAARDARPLSVTLEHYLHTPVAFIILPIFAFCNAGVVFTNDITQSLTNPLGLGIIIGLVLGKQIGITLFTWLTVKSGKAMLPDGVTWKQIYGVSWLAGIGFTMAIFVAGLSFSNPDILNQAKMAILVASVIAGIGGLLICNFVLPKTSSSEPASLEPTA